MRVVARNQWARGAVLCVASLTLLPSGANYLFAQENAAEPLGKQLPPEAIEELETQAEGMKAFSFTYTRAREGDVPRNYIGKPENHTTAVDGKRFYRRDFRILKERSGKIEKQAHETGYDGQFLYTGNPTRPDDPGELTKYRVDDKTEPRRKQRKLKFPFLETAGVHTPRSIGELDRRNTLAEPKALYYLREGKEVEVQKTSEGWELSASIRDLRVEAVKERDLEEYRERLLSGPMSKEEIRQKVARNERLKKAEPVRRIALTLSPERGYNVVREEVRASTGNLLWRKSCEGWRFWEVSGVWLPMQCTKTEYAEPYKPQKESQEVTEREIYRVQDVEFGRPDVEFALEKKAGYREEGTLIYDRSTAEAREADDHEVRYEVSGRDVRLGQYVSLFGIVAVVFGLGVWFARRKRA